MLELREAEALAVCLAASKVGYSDLRVVVKLAVEKAVEKAGWMALKRAALRAEMLELREAEALAVRLVGL